MPSTPKKPTIDETLDWLIPGEEDLPVEDTWPAESEEADETWDDGEEEPTILISPSEEGLKNDSEGPPLQEQLPQSVIVGHRETVSLPEHGVQQLLARFATDAERSTLHGKIHQVVANHMTLELGQTVVELPAFEEQGTLFVALVVDLEGIRFSGNLQVVATSGPPFLILGRDLIAGQVVVDPSNAWVKSKR
jgi:hypothetical protein